MSQQSALAGSAWWVEDIDHKGVVDRSHTTLHFVDGSQVAGDSACNRYRGTVEVGDEGLQFGAIAGTRRACVAAIADQEQRFYDALARVVAWEIAATGLLHLLDAEGSSIIRASRINPDEA